VVSFADNPRSGSRASYERERGGGGIFGWYGVPPAYAMLARRHMGDYGTKPEDLGAIAVACRRHGAANPAAQLRKPLTLDDYMASEFVVSPFRRHDCALITDGAAAVVLMSERRAKASGVRHAVPILGLGQSHGAWDVSLRPDLSTSSAVASGEQAFRMAGLVPKDIDVAQIYDCFTITALITLEDYGFCRKGEGGSFVRDGALEIGGRLPMNTAGGLLSETGMPGLQLVLEGVRQMRGEAVSQVPGARTCVVSNQGGIMQSHATMILGQAL
jgi:acetyl-CoA acetyltransferase